LLTPPRFAKPTTTVSDAPLASAHTLGEAASASVSDGAPVASIESCDLVPDLLRVDEQCALYVAEESGHLGCYELAARLSLVH
jgi:hypothetical protein